MPVDARLVLTIGEVASILRCGVRAIEQPLAAGTFPIAPLPSFGTSSRRRRLFARADVLRFVEGRTDGSGFDTRERVRRGRLHHGGGHQARRVGQGAGLSVDPRGHRGEAGRPEALIEDAGRGVRPRDDA